MTKLIKKEQRLQLLEYKTKALTEKGYIKETYRDLLIFTNEPELLLAAIVSVVREIDIAAGRMSVIVPEYC